MKETGIIMSGDHPRLVLDGLKTQTRRTAGLQKINENPDGWGALRQGCPSNPLWSWLNCQTGERNGIKCPYGQVGDRLWVRETFVIENDTEYGYSEEELKGWAKDRPIKTQVDWEEDGQYHLIPHYRATEPEPNIVPEDADDFDDKTRWAPSIFMPRWASRILLEITGLRAERVQDISEADAKAEGCVADESQIWWQGYKEYPLGDLGTELMHQQSIGEQPPDWMIEPHRMLDRADLLWTARKKFIPLWDSLNAKRGYGWDFNPWLWVISFKLLTER